MNTSRESHLVHLILLALFLMQWFEGHYELLGKTETRE